MKIGFCFLMYKGLAQHKAWVKFFKKADPESFEIYCHSKKPKKAERQKLLKGKHISTHIKTKWADVSLVEASLNLFKEALDDACDYIFLLSDTCVPIHTFNFIKNKIKDKKSIIHYNVRESLSGTGDGEYFDITETSRRYKKSKSIKNYVKESEFIKAEQWVALNKKDAKAVLDDPTLIEYFDDVFAGDEHFVPTVLSQKGKLESCHNKPITYTNWENQKKWEHPKTFSYISRKELSTAKNSGCFFLCFFI